MSRRGMGRSNDKIKYWAMLIYYPCDSFIEQTSVKIEGNVTKYAEKIKYTEGKETAYTYIKAGSTGLCSDICHRLKLPVVRL